jgi:transmembrane sensor
VALKSRESWPSEPAHAGPWRWRIAAAVSVLTLSLLGGIVAKTAWLDRTIETAADEWRQVALTDGSTMRLTPRTQVKVEFSDRRRTIHLLRGQAFFQVAKDKERAFYVNSGIASVRAVGTEFGVSWGNDDITVTVQEGRVAVSRTIDPPAGQHDGVKVAMLKAPAEIPVSADEQVKLSLSDGPLDVKKVNAANELAWARQRLVFDTETIAEAVEMFNRLNRVQLSIDSAEIAQWRACCVFDATDPEAFAEAMAQDPGIELVRDPAGVLHLVAELPPYDAGQTSAGQVDAF